MSPTQFLSLLGASATHLYQTTPLFASVTLAQAADETGWLAFLPHDIHTGQNSYNIYGVKGVGPAGSVECYTQEWQNGAYVTILAQFAAYENYFQSLQSRAHLLLTDAQYHAVLQAATPFAQCYALQDCGYATSPTYGQTLSSIIRDFDLTRFDTKKKSYKHYNVTVGWFDSKKQAQQGASRISKATGYHASVQQP